MGSTRDGADPRRLRHTVERDVEGWPHVLIVESGTLGLSIRRGLAAYEPRCSPTWVRHLDSAERSLRESRWDFVVIDVDLEDGSGVVLLRRIRAMGLDVPVLMLAGAEQLSSASGLVNVCDLHDAWLATKPEVMPSLYKHFDEVLVGFGDIDAERQVVAVARIFARRAALSPRERDVLLEALSGGSGRQRARQLGISIGRHDELVAMLKAKISRLPEAAAVSTLRDIVELVRTTAAMERAARRR